MTLPYGRALGVHLRARWRLGYARCAGARLLWLGPLLIVLYTSRMTWERP